MLQSEDSTVSAAYENSGGFSESRAERAIAPTNPLFALHNVLVHPIESSHCTISFSTPTLWDREREKFIIIGKSLFTAFKVSHLLKSTGGGGGGLFLREKISSM